MRIDRIELYLVCSRFREPWRTAYGTDYENCALFTRMVSGENEGWSEASPLPRPNYCYEYGNGIYQVAAKFLAPLLVGREFDSAKDVNEAMASVKGNPFAKSGLEMAWWTLDADRKKLPLHKLFAQNKTKRFVDEGAGVGICDNYDSLIEKVGRAFDSGTKRVKLKVTHGWDIDMIAAVRSVFPNEMIHIDCNASYRFDEIGIFRQLDRFHLAMIEQPFMPNAIYDHAKLQKAIDTPICLDESIVDTESAVEALELGACRYINLKPSRVGGFETSLQINQLCSQAGVGCWVGGMLESDVGKATHIELACIDNMIYPHDITAASENYIEPISERPLEHVAPWTYQITEHTGTPICPDKCKLFSRAVQKCAFGDVM